MFNPGNIPYFRSTPHPVTVTTRIITFLIGNPYKPSFATVSGWGVDPTHTNFQNVALRGGSVGVPLGSHDSSSLHPRCNGGRGIKGNLNPCARFVCSAQVLVSMMMISQVGEYFYHQEFPVPKMEVLNLIRLFWGGETPLHKPYPYSLYR